MRHWLKDRHVKMGKSIISRAESSLSLLWGPLPVRQAHHEQGSSHTPDHMYKLPLMAEKSSGPIATSSETETKIDMFSDLTTLVCTPSPLQLIFFPPSGVKGPDVSATASSVSGGAVQTGPADVGHPPFGAAQPVNHPDSYSGGDWSVRLRGASTEGFTARDPATQLHE